MSTVFDVAQYILGKTGEVCTMKLQKLCYYAQAWSLVWTGEPLFPEPFQAWVCGPVCPELYQAHRGKFTAAPGDFPKGDAAALSLDQRDTVDRVLENYASWEPYELREQVRSERPWKDVRQGLADDEQCSREISQASITEYFKGLCAKQRGEERV